MNQLPDMTGFTPEQRFEAVQQQKAINRIHSAIAKREQDRAAKPTGVRLRSADGTAQDIYDDGSVRNLYKRNPALSGRQFRKARKAVRRKLAHALQHQPIEPTDNTGE